MKFLNLAAKPEHPEDRTLARQICRGDEAAITGFMNQYFPRLYRFALIRLNYHEQDAEDVVQHTLSIAARKMDTYRGEASLMTWLTQICRREVGRFAKQVKRRQEIISLIDDEPLMAGILESMIDNSADPSELSSRHELMTLVHTVLDQLPNRQGDVLEWKYIEGLSTREIAERLGLGDEAVQSLSARAKRGFRRLFTEVSAVYLEGQGQTP